MTHWRCSGVSGMEQPRADSTAQNALPTSHPSRTKMDTASTEERPILARQCTPSDHPALTISTRYSTVRKKLSLSDGTERSRIGRFTNLIAAASHSFDSRRIPSSAVSSLAKREFCQLLLLLVGCRGRFGWEASAVGKGNVLQLDPHSRLTLTPIKVGRMIFFPDA